MPMSHWVKCIDADHRFARKAVDLSTKETSEDLDRWFLLYDQYLIKYGFNQKYLRVLKVLERIAKLQLKYVRTRDRFIETLLSIEQAKLEALKRENKHGVTTEKALVIMGKWYGGGMMRMDQITVVQYEELSQAYREAMRQNKETERKNKRNGKS